MIPYEAHRHIFDFLPTYFVLFVIGWTSVFYIALKEAKRLKVKQKDIIIIGVVGILSAMLFARIFYFLGPWNAKLPWYAVFNFKYDAYVFYGAFIGGFLGVIIAAKKLKLNVWKMLDIAALVFGLGMFFGRIGCFFAGCCYGEKTTLPIGLSYIGKNYARFPAPVISSIYNLLLFVFLSFFKHKKKWDGQIALLLFMIYPVLRFAIESFRSYAWDFMGLTASQIISIAIFIPAVILYIKKRK